jgi:hypothetical protein
VSLRIRGQEIAVQLVVNGALQAGSFAFVSDFKLTPRADVSNSPFLGETEDEPDVQHHGYDFSFSLHQSDGNALAFWNSVVQTLEAGTAQPQTDILVTKTYRDAGTPATNTTLRRVAIKMDSEEFGGRKDYVKNSFSGSCAKISIR